MISIIICSIDQKALKKVSESIKNTIGVPYEVIAIDNSQSRYSICEAYNIGASKSQFDYLCFIHEDVNFRTVNWGLNAIHHFISNECTGVIGVAGSVYKTRMISSWWQPKSFGVEPKRINIIQHYKYEKKEKEHILINPLNELRSIVASLDGVFLFTKKEIWQNVKFDECLLKGFHGYDLDFTLRAGEYKNNLVVFDILLEHFSEGRVDVNWYQQMYLVHKKLHRNLPVVAMKDIRKSQLRDINKWHLENYLNYLGRFSVNGRRTAFMFVRLIIYSKLFKINRYVIKRLFSMIVFGK